MILLICTELCHPNLGFEQSIRYPGHVLTMKLGADNDSGHCVPLKTHHQFHTGPKPLRKPQVSLIVRLFHNQDFLSLWNQCH